MTKEKKLQQLLEMQEHPERYTDEEIRHLMADEECRLQYEQMVRAADAIFAGKTVKNRYWAKATKTVYKMAAACIALLILSGIAYAAYHYSAGRDSAEGNLTIPTQETRIADSHQQEDSVMQSPVIFENAELATVLSEIATYHNYKVTYRSEDTKHVRLYFKWDKDLKIDEIVEMFNKFERIHIAQENQQLIVEVTNSQEK